LIHSQSDLIGEASLEAESGKLFHVEIQIRVLRIVELEVDFVKSVSAVAIRGLNLQNGHSCPGSVV
jgi:hypothetical protein